MQEIIRRAKAREQFIKDTLPALLSKMGRFTGSNQNAEYATKKRGEILCAGLALIFGLVAAHSFLSGKQQDARTAIYEAGISLTALWLVQNKENLQ